MTTTLNPDKTGIVSTTPMQFPAIADPAGIATRGQLYGKTVGGRIEAHWMDSLGSSTQLTASGSPAGAISFPVLAPDGTVGAPSYSFSNDGSMGMYRSAADQLSFGIKSGNEGLRVYWDGFFYRVAAKGNNAINRADFISVAGGGNQGIATTTTSVAMVQGGVNRATLSATSFDISARSLRVISAQMQVQNWNGTAGAPQLEFIDTSWKAGIFKPTLSHAMGFSTAGVERFRIDDNVAANETPLQTKVSGSGLLRISVGAADSGAAGFRLLRVPN